MTGGLGTTVRGFVDEHRVDGTNVGTNETFDVVQELRGEVDFKREM